MHFAAAIWLVALLLPALLWLAVKAADRRARDRARALLGERAGEHRETFHPRARGWQRFFYLAAIFWLVVALARPQWGASEVTVTQRGRDVVVALDVSNSMLAEDVTPNRLERAKAELVTFLRHQSGSRVGLVLFAGEAFVQCPLTADYGTAEIFLQMAATDMISSQGTALASALEVARDLLLSGRPEGGGDDFQAILLVTDGEDLEGDWEEVARDCRRDGITVIPVGIGEETGGLIPVTDREGRSAGFLKDDDGQLVLSRIDLASLEKLASIGGGSAFRVGLDGLAGERLRTVLDRLGSRDFEQRQVTRWQERYPWFLLLAVISLGVALSIRPRRREVALAAVLILLVGSPASAQVIRPDWADHVDAGRSAYTAGDYETALQEFETARALAPDEPRLTLAVGETLFRLERHEEAAREFERAQQLSDRRDLRAESLYNAGTNALAQGDAEGAVEKLRESLRLEPDRPDALHNLEAALLLQQQQEQQQEQQQDDQQQQEQQQEQQQDQQQQDQQPQDDQQPPDDEQDQQDQQQEQQQQQPDESEEQDEPQDQPQPEPEPSREELDREQALQLLKALDRDEQELKRSVDKRLKGGKPRSGKRW